MAVKGLLYQPIQGSVHEHNLQTLRLSNIDTQFLSFTSSTIILPICSPVCESPTALNERPQSTSMLPIQARWSNESLERLL
jgi:hypothetical protein